MSANDSESYLPCLNKYNNTFIHNAFILLIKIKADYFAPTEKIEANFKTPKFKVNDRMRITKYKNSLV